MSFQWQKNLLISIFSLSLFTSISCRNYELVGPVNDYAKVLTADQNQQLTELLLKEEKMTGNQVVILTVSELEDQTIEELSLKFFEKVKLGKVGKDNGILLVCAIKDRKVRIEVGYGLEGKMTDAQCWSIISNQIAPQFKEKRYFDGLLKASQKIHQIIVGEFENNEQDQGYPWFYYFLGYLLIILVGFFFIGLIFGPPEFDEEEIGPRIIKSSLWIFLAYLANIIAFSTIFGFSGKFIAWPILLSLSSIFCLTGLIFKPFRVLVGLGVFLFFGTIFKILKESAKNDRHNGPNNHFGHSGGFGGSYSSGSNSSSGGGGYSGGGGRSGGGGSSGSW